MEIAADDAGWVRVQRLEIAWRAIEVAGILGRATEMADLVVQRFIDPEPPPLDGASLSVPMRIPAICARASDPVARRCFSRFRAFQARLSGGILPATNAFVDGAERYRQGDWQGAAKAWRPLLRQPGMFTSVLSEEMAITFQHTGDLELVERLDSTALSSDAGEFNGASLAHVRAARRAAAGKDRERARARALARRVIEAWSVADETVPAVDEMRKLLARLL
jgi:eukaryotic-like serine/threonine-protein kinase